MHSIPIYFYFDDPLAGYGERWLLRRWLLPEGTVVSSGDLIAEVESDRWIAALACDYYGLLRHSVSEGGLVSRGVPVARVEASDQEYQRYLQVGGKVRLDVCFTPEELHSLESCRGTKSRDEFIRELIRQVLDERYLSL